MRKLALVRMLAASLALVASPASAVAEDVWSFRTVPDGQGSDFALLTGRLEGERVLYAECSKSGAILALIAIDLPYEAGDVGLNLYVEIDGNERLSTGEYFGTEGGEGVTYSGTDYLEAIFRDLGAAQSSVSMRVVDYSDGSDITWPALGLDGLAESADRFTDFCYGGDAPAPVTEWSVTQPLADVEAGYRGVMSGMNGDGIALRLTCSIDASVWTIGLDGPAVVSEGATGLAVDIEGLTWEFPAEPSAGPAVVASGSTRLAELSTVLALPREAVLVEVLAGSERTPYRFTAGEPAAAAALEMFSTCYALR